MRSYLKIVAIAALGLLSFKLGLAQVSLKNNPDKSAALDLSGNNKGLLIPRLNLSSTTDVSGIVNSTPAQSLLVYNTNNTITGSGAAGSGYYYWDTNIWKKLMTGTNITSNAWSVKGNSGTSPGTNFVGTTDAQDLVVKTNGAENMRVTAAGNIGIGTASPAYTLDLNGTARIADTLTLGVTPNATTSATSTLVRDVSTGQVYKIASSTGNTKAYNYIHYIISNVNQDWLNDFNTKIPYSDYTVVLVGTQFNAGGSNLWNSGTSGTFVPARAYAAPNKPDNSTDGYWHLRADYVSGSTVTGNGTWDIYCLVINKSVLKANFPTQTLDLGGTATGSFSAAPAGL